MNECRILPKSYPTAISTHCLKKEKHQLFCLNYGLNTAMEMLEIKHIWKSFQNIMGKVGKEMKQDWPGVGNC